MKWVPNTIAPGAFYGGLGDLGVYVCINITVDITQNRFIMSIWRKENA